MKVLIDGQKIEVAEKKTILDVARANGIYIPSLCDHQLLQPFSGCRLCLVEVKGRKGYVPACSTYTEDSLEVLTQTPEIQKLRRQILELILSEHPSACLICSEKEKCEEHKLTIRKVGEVTGCVLCSNNGRCALQAVVEALKIDRVNYPWLYRNFEVRRDDPFFDRDYNLCILCGRCVRICQEVRGASALAFVFRGTQAVVGTALDKRLIDSDCQFCGACLDVCPTGALVERIIRYEGLPDKKVETVCALCSLGCELNLEIKNGKILSSAPLESGAVNRGQACLKGRFLVRDLVNNQRRIQKPMIRKNHGLEEVGWDEVLSFVAQKLSKYNAKEIGLAASSQGTSEDIFVFHKFAKQGLKTENFLNPADSSPLSNYWHFAQDKCLEPHLNFKLEDIAQAKLLVVFGEDIAFSHPIIWIEMLKAIKKKAKLVILSSRKFCILRCAYLGLQIKPGSEHYLLGVLSRLLLESEEAEILSNIEGFEELKRGLQEINFSDPREACGVSEEELKTFANLLQKNKPAIFLFGQALSQVPWKERNLSSLWNLALLTQARVVPLDLEANSRAAFEISRLFHNRAQSNQSSKSNRRVEGLINQSRGSLTVNHMLQSLRDGSLKALFLAGPFPSLETKPEFLVIQDSYFNSHVKFADVVLPSTTFVETEGTSVNIEGRLQKFGKAVEPRGEARPDWWIISRLAQKMGFSGFHYKSASEVREEMNKTLPAFSGISLRNFEKDSAFFIHEDKKHEDGKEHSHKEDTNKALADKKDKNIKFIPIFQNYLPSKSCSEYPFLLQVEFSSDYYKSFVLGNEIKGVRIIRNPRWIKINPEDARALGLEDGEEVMVDSAFGELEGQVKITGTMPGGVLEATYVLGFSPEFLTLGIIPVKLKSKK